MKNFCAYLSKQGPFCFGLFIACAVFTVVFWLFDGVWSLYFYALELIAFVSILYLSWRLASFKREVQITKRVQVLEGELRRCEEELLRGKQELQRYMLMWTHQMKTPLTAASLLLQESGLDEPQRILALRRELLQIENYTNMALSYLKLQDPTADMDIISLDLDPLLRRLVKRYSFLFIQKRLRLVFEATDAVVVSDSRWLEIMLEQLLSNALKYTEQGEIALAFDRARNCLLVRDSGLGIMAQDLPKIFDHGYSGYNGRSNEKSSGLGLFLAHLIAKRLQIRLELDSVVGEGTCFYVFFPKCGF